METEKTLFWEATNTLFQFFAAIAKLVVMGRLQQDVTRIAAPICMTEVGSISGHTVGEARLTRFPGNDLGNLETLLRSFSTTEGHLATAKVSGDRNLGTLAVFASTRARPAKVDNFFGDSSIDGLALRESGVFEEAEIGGVQNFHF